MLGKLFFLQFRILKRNGMNSDYSFPSSTPKISVLVPVYNDIDRVGLCIEKLQAIDYPASCYEVIIIDNGSTDGTYEYLQQLMEGIASDTFRLLQCLTPGSYAARNKGLQVASGEYVAFTDSDCLVSTEWLTNLLRCAAQQHGDVIVAGKVSFFSDASKQTQQSALDFENMFSMKQDQNANSGKCITANLFCSIIYSEKSEVFHPSRNKSELLIKRRRVVGGTWDAELSKAGFKEKLRFCVGLVKMFLGRTKKTCLHSGLSIKRKISLVWLLLLIFLF
jgi:glycosyltransferase involved in cell wall biosynthesis